MVENLALTLARAVWRSAVAACLLIGLVAVLTYSLDHAGWVPGAQWWPGTWLSLLGGGALAGARWRGRWAFLYSAFMLMTGAAQLVGHVLPEPVQLWQAPSDWVWNLHLRTIALGLRWQAWGAAIARGRPVGDTGLFVWLVAMLAWGAVAWLAWSALRRRQALEGCLPAAIALAVNTYLSAQPWQEVLLFVLLALGLVIYTTYASQNADWEQRGVDYPDDLGLDWGTAAIGLTLSIGLLSASAPVVATPSGWHLLSDLLASSRQQVAATADQLFSGVKPPSAGVSEPVARTPDLTNIGSALDQSQDTVMWVKVDEAAPASYPGALPPPQHYWRSGLYAAYTGSGWQPVQVVPGGAVPAQAAGPPPAGRYALQQQFEIVAQHGLAQFAANRPVSATTIEPGTGGPTQNRGALVGLDPADEGTILLAGPASKYSVVSWATRATQAELRAASANYPASLRSVYLQLPAGLPSRVAVLARQITGGAADPYDQALRLQDYLRRTYAYRLDVPPPPPGSDAVDYFLFEAPGGYCSYYASAMAVMLRTLGVPARVATGYAMGVYDTGRDAYRVPGAAAHAWVEVYFPTIGWVEFEPTPARAVFERTLGDSSATPTTPAPATGTAAPVAPAPQAVALVLGVSALVLGVAGWARWQFAARRPPDNPRQQVVGLYRRIRSALSRAGLGAPASVTADEYLQARSDVLSAHPPLLAAMTEATDLFRQAAYSPHPVSEAQARAAQHLWAKSRVAWIRLTISRIEQHLRGSRR